VPRRSDCRVGLRVWSVAILAGSALLSNARAASEVTPSPQPIPSHMANLATVAPRIQSDSYERPEAQVIRAKLNEIRSERRLTPRKSFAQWLAEKFAAWRGPWHSWQGSWVKTLMWVFLIWAVITLLFILGHLIWTVKALAGMGLAGGARAAGARRVVAGRRISSDELRAQALQMARNGAHREAVGLLMMALLLQLDEAGILRFDPSKTNGDYVRECAPVLAQAAAFRGFVLSFDEMIYGARRCEQDSFDRMNALFERVLCDAAQGRQN
jgi:hypothetical protein